MLRNVRGCRRARFLAVSAEELGSDAHAHAVQLLLLPSRAMGDLAARGRRFFQSVRGRALRAALPACPTRIWEPVIAEVFYPERVALRCIWLKARPGAIAEASLKALRASSQVLDKRKFTTSSKLIGFLVQLCVLVDDGVLQVLQHTHRKPRHREVCRARPAAGG